MARNLLAFFGVALMIIGFIGHFYFGRYHGTVIPRPFLFQIASWAIGLLGFYILFSSVISFKKNIDMVIDSWKEKMKLNGERILVNLRECEVKENSYFEEVDKVYSARAQSFNAMVGEDHRNVETVPRYASLIIFTYNDPKTGEKKEFRSPVIPKDKISLSFIISSKKETFIYVDRDEPDNYFFDLDFLSE